LLSTYLLLAIGLKGGVQLSLADPAGIAWPAVATFGLGAGMAVGVAVGPDRFAPFEPLFVGAFKPILAFFVLEMGLLAAHRLPELRRNGVRVGAAALLIPVVGGAIGGWAGLTAGLSPGGATVLATLAASASYIAAPAAVRLAIPEANTGMCVAAALGVTFPFNLSVGIPLYAWWVGWLAR